MSLVFNLFRTLSPGLEKNYKLKCCSAFSMNPDMHGYFRKFAETNFAMYGCSPIQGRVSNSVQNGLKLGAQSGTYPYVVHFLSKSVLKNTSRLVTRASLNECTLKDIILFLTKVTKMSE